MTQSSNFVPLLGAKAATIAASGTLSTVIETNGATAVGISIPDAWTTGDITFSVLPQGGSTYSNSAVTTAGAYTFTGVVANDYLILDPQYIAGVNQFKIKCSVAQGAERVLSVQFAPVLDVQNTG